MKKILLILLFLAAIVMIVLAVFKEKKHSNIISKYKVTEGQKGIASIPLAEVPGPLPEYTESITGRVVQMKNNPKDPDSKSITVLSTENNEIIVLANVLYIHTLKVFYPDRMVKLHGKSRKNVVIYGKEYKCFWVEDIDLFKPPATKSN